MKANMKPFLCNGTSCKLACKRGSAPIGKERVSCRTNRNEEKGRNTVEK